MLVDVTERVAEAGFRVPVAVTAAVWAECVEWPETERGSQDQSGRLWDVLLIAAWRQGGQPGEGRGIGRLSSCWWCLEAGRSPS